MTVIEEAEERLKKAVNAARFRWKGELTNAYQWPLSGYLANEVMAAALNLIVQKELAGKVAEVCLKKEP
jgi:hypothetical protein